MDRANSEALDTPIKPIQFRGLLKPRDIHKKPLDAAISRFDAQDAIHQSIATLARDSALTLAQGLPEPLATVGGDPEALGPHALGRLGTKLRQEVRALLIEIDGLVEGLPHG